jgi:hypothetical protein
MLLTSGVGERDDSGRHRHAFGGNYGLALALVAGSAAIIIAVLTSLGVEAKGVAFGAGRRRPAAA